MIVSYLLPLCKSLLGPDAVARCDDSLCEFREKVLSLQPFVKRENFGCICDNDKGKPPFRQTRGGKCRFCQIEISMKIIKTPIEGLLVIEPDVFGDARGFFQETYNEERYRAAGIEARFVQDNMSSSAYGVVRGLHFQRPPYTQAKLVQCIEGRVLDVAVDLRYGSPAFGQHFAVELSAENHRQFFIPRGFAHGFSVLSEHAVFSYKCDNLYHPEADGGILLTDPALGIDWHIPADKMILSEKDKHHPLLRDMPHALFKM